ncbi:hypothetical protein D3C71_1454400 [compost metagenome]
MPYLRNHQPTELHFIRCCFSASYIALTRHLRDIFRTLDDLSTKTETTITTTQHDNCGKCHQAYCARIQSHIRILPGKNTANSSSSIQIKTRPDRPPSSELGNLAIQTEKEVRKGELIKWLIAITAFALISILYTNEINPKKDVSAETKSETSAPLPAR